MHMSGDPPGYPWSTRDRKIGGQFLPGEGEFIKTKSPGSGASQDKFNLKLTLCNATVTGNLYPTPTPKKQGGGV